MLEIVLPFGLPPPELAADLIRSLQTPALARLLACSSLTAQTSHDPMAGQLPHELWLSQRFGAAQFGAPGQMQALGLPAEPGFWFVLNPVHLHIARDHLVLTDARQLALSAEHATLLFQIAQNEFAGAGLQARYGQPQTWFLRADDWAELQTCSLDAACGHNIDIWMPRGAMARAWRKLQNEIQMAWFEHPLHQQRADLPLVNSLWLSSGGATQAPAAASATGAQSVKADITQLLRTSQVRRARDVAQLGASSILLADTLIAPALAGDWAAWLEEMAHLDQQWLTQALQLGQLRLTLSHNHISRSFTCSRWRLAQFWRRSGLSRLS